LSTSQSSSSTEVEILKHRVENTEREKRDLVGVVSRLKEDSAQREGSSIYLQVKTDKHLKLRNVEEIQTLRSNLKQARQEHQALEAQVRELRSTETSTKVKRLFISQVIPY
jgi:nucleoprotein TPR